MKLRNVLYMLTVATCTATLTLAVLMPARAGAGDPPKLPAPRIAQPKLTVDGCQVTLAWGKESYDPGEKPALVVKATNPTDKAVDTQVYLTMTSTSPRDQFSRRMVIPASLWQQECHIRLEPGQTETYVMGVSVALPAGQIVTVSMADKARPALSRRLRVNQAVRNNNAAPAAKAKAAVKAEAKQG